MNSSNNLLSFVIDEDYILPKKLLYCFTNACKLIQTKLKIKNKTIFDVCFVNQHEIRILNKKYRNIDKATDVLSF